MSHRIDTPDPLWDPEQQIAALREQVARVEGERQKFSDAADALAGIVKEMRADRGKLATRCRELEAACKEQMVRLTDMFNRHERKTYAEGSNPDTDLDLILASGRAAMKGAKPLFTLAPFSLIPHTIPMANSNVKLITTEDGYKLVVGGEESEVMDYGEPLEFNGYLAFVDLPEGSEEAEDVECRLENWVYKIQPVTDVEPEEEDEDDEDEEEGDGGEGADVVVEAGAFSGDDEDEDDDEDEGIV